MEKIRNQATSLRVLFALFLITHAELTPLLPRQRCKRSSTCSQLSTTVDRLISRSQEVNTPVPRSQIVVVEFSKAIYTAAGNLQDSRANLWKDITRHPIRKFNRNDETSWNVVNLRCFFTASPPESSWKILYGILNELDRSWIRKWNATLPLQCEILKTLINSELNFKFLASISKNCLCFYKMNIFLKFQFC